MQSRKIGDEKESKTMYGCFVESHASTRQRAESVQSKMHEDRIAGKGFTSMTHYNLVHKFIQMPQSIKIPDAKAAVEKEWKKLETTPAWNLERVKSKKGGYSGSTKRQKESQLCHTDGRMPPQKMRSWNQNYRSTKAVVLREDIVKDGSGVHVDWTRLVCVPDDCRKVMDVIASLPGCDGPAADAASAFSHVKLEDAPRLLKIPKSECPDVWKRLPRHKWPKSWATVEDPVIHLQRNLYGHKLAGFVWERQFEDVLLQLWWEKVPNWECSFVHRNKDSHRYTWMTLRWLERNRIWLSCGRKRWKLWILKTSLIIHWPFINALSDSVTWQTRKWSSFTKLQVLAWMIINSSRKNSNLLEHGQKFAHKLSCNACIWHELDDLTSCGQ